VDHKWSKIHSDLDITMPCAVTHAKRLRLPVSRTLFRIGPFKEQPCKKEVSFALYVVKDPMFGSTAGGNIAPDKEGSIAEWSLGRSILSKTNQRH
jgi:hypothetical protein